MNTDASSIISFHPSASLPAAAAVTSAALILLARSRLQRKRRADADFETDERATTRTTSFVGSDDGLARTKAELIGALRGKDGGGTTKASDPAVASALGALREAHRRSGFDCRETSDSHPIYDGDFLLEHNPAFLGLLGCNEDGDPMYTMGRMAFGMIRPTDMVCSIQGVTQHVHKLSRTATNGKWDLPSLIPSKLRDAVEARAGDLRTFDTIMDFTVEDADPKKKRSGSEEISQEHWKIKGPKGVMTVEGYAFPNPEVPNRYSIWFTSGVCRAKSRQDAPAFQKIFGGDLPSYTLSEKMMLFAAKLMMGAEPSDGINGDGAVSFALNKPVAAYQDVAYLDDDLRVTIGSAGTLVVVSRLPAANT